MGTNPTATFTSPASAGICQWGKARKAKRGPTARSAIWQIGRQVPPQPTTPMINPNDEAVLDKLIAVFASKTPKEWRKLIAHSQQWPQLAEKVFERLHRQSQFEEDDEKKMELRKMHRQLQSVHEELRSYDDTVAIAQRTAADELETIVVEIRPQLTNGFFEHLDNLVHAAYKDEEQCSDLATLSTRLLVLASSYDAVAADDEAQDAALDKFRELTEVTSIREMDDKLADMAKAGQLDPALMLTIARAHNSIKETDYTKEEVRDVMAHLYKQARIMNESQQPPEVRILKFLLTMNSPEDRLSALHDAFSPGPELQTGQQEMLYTTPEAMLTVMEAVLGAYAAQETQRAPVQDAASMMNPEVIRRMKELHQQIRKHFT